MTIYATFKAIQVAFNTINLNIYFTNLSIDCIVDLFVIFVDFYIDVFVNLIKDCCVIFIDFNIDIFINFIKNCSIVVSDCSIDIISNHCIVSFNLSIDCIFHISDCSANLAFQFLDIIFVSTNTCGVIFNIALQVV